MTDAQEFNAKLDALGAAEVRAGLASGAYMGAERLLAAAWITRHSEASNAEQLAIAREARDAAVAAARAADAANIKATIALIIAVISTIAAIVGVIGWDPFFTSP